MIKILIDANVILRYLLNDIEAENKNIVIESVKIFSETNLDFVDCILIAYNRIENVEIFSFDKKLNNKLKKKPFGKSRWDFFFDGEKKFL